MLAKAKQLKTTADEYEDEGEDEVTPDGTIISSYKTAKIIRNTSSAIGSQQVHRCAYK